MWSTLWTILISPHWGLKMPKEVRALARGLALMDVLAEEPNIRLARILRRTPLPKATVLRLLHTLEESGWVYRRGDGAYRLSAELGLRTRPPHPHDRLAELATPLLACLQAQTGWPSMIAVRDGARMRIVDMTVSSGGMMVNYQVVGRRVHMLWSGLGRAYLAHCAAKERTEIVEALKKTGDPRDEMIYSVSWVRKVLNATRERGFGTRDPSLIPLSDPEDSSLGAIAVPVMRDGCVVACINVVWARALVPDGDAHQRYLPPLVETGRRLEQALDEAGFRLI